jgi:DNA alkylation repair enzyme
MKVPAARRSIAEKDLSESTSIAKNIAVRLRAQTSLGAATLHRLRRTFSKELEGREGAVVIAVAHRLLDLRGVPGARMIACALVGQHSRALVELKVSELERLGRGMAHWGEVDAFGCLVAGRVWRDGAIADKTIFRWARSADRWWRRAALVSTVPLNVRSQGGRGDARRTLAVCALLVADEDDVIIKALSWALRELAVRDPQSVATFMAQHREVLAARIRREVGNKLDTGRKTPPRRRSKAGADRSS